MSPTPSPIKPRPPVLTPFRLRRPREFLYHREIILLAEAASSMGQHGLRNATLILFSYRHALRVSEVAALTWEDFCFEDGMVYIHRAKNGISNMQPIFDDELRLLRHIQCPTGAVFRTDRDTALTVSAIYKMIAKAGRIAGLPFPVHPHMLRHSCGFALVLKDINLRKIQKFMGHRNIQSTLRYTHLTPKPFESMWSKDEMIQSNYAEMEGITTCL